MIDMFRSGEGGGLAQLHFEGGRSIQARLVVGADGANSRSGSLSHCGPLNSMSAAQQSCELVLRRTRCQLTVQNSLLDVAWSHIGIHPEKSPVF